MGAPRLHPALYTSQARCFAEGSQSDQGANNLLSLALPSLCRVPSVESLV